MPFPVDVKFITESEKKLGVKFPPSYVNKMETNNGGEVRTSLDAWNLYPIFDTSDKKRLKRTCNDVVRETCSARDWPEFPLNAIAIANNGCGDQLVFLQQGEDAESLTNEVYWWNHETGQLNKVADDFGELLEN